MIANKRPNDLSSPPPLLRPSLNSDPKVKGPFCANGLIIDIMVIARTNNHARLIINGKPCFDVCLECNRFPPWLLRGKLVRH